MSELHRTWLAPILTGVIATVVGGVMLFALYPSGNSPSPKQGVIDYGKTEQGVILGRWNKFVAPPRGSKPTIVHIGKRYVCYTGGAGKKYKITSKAFGTMDFHYEIVSMTDQPATAEILITRSEKEAKAINPNC